MELGASLLAFPQIETKTVKPLKKVLTGSFNFEEAKKYRKAFCVSGASGLFSNKINGTYACVVQPQNGAKKFYHTEKTFKLLKKDGTLDNSTISFCHMDDGRGYWIIERWGLAGEGSCHLMGYCKVPNLPHPANAKKWFLINASEQWVLHSAIKIELVVETTYADSEPTKSNALRSRISHALAGF